jgi:hypothetical protein
MTLFRKVQVGRATDDTVLYQKRFKDGGNAKMMSEPSVPWRIQGKRKKTEGEART